MWISTLLFWGFVTWLVVSPDKVSHTVTRGMWGAARGWANPEYASKSSKKPGRPGAAQGSRWAGLLDGWGEGVRVARQRRANGQDVWSRGSYLAGRAWGASESIRGGVARIPARVAAWRAQRAAKKGAPTVQGEVIDPEPMTEQTSTPGDDVVVEGVVIDKQNKPYVDPITALDRDLRRFNQDRTMTWEEIKAHGASGQIWACFDCFELILEGDPRLPYVPADPGQGTYFWVRDGWDCQVCGGLDDGPYARAFPIRTDNGGGPTQVLPAPPDDLAADPAEGAPAEGAGAPTTTTTPALAGERMNPMSDMSIGELENIGAVKAEGVDSAGSLLAMLDESMAAAKTWAPGFQDRWGGSNWGTEGISNAIAMIAEGAEALGTAELMLAGVAALREALEEAQTLAEMAAEVKATGDVSSFAEA